MCEACGPRLSRRRALVLAGGTLAALAGPARSAPVRAAPTEYGISIQSRASWAGDSRPVVGELGAEDVRFLLVHHTASANGADPIGTMRGVYNFHTSPEKGWPDVAYNFFIDQNGVVYEARTGSLDGPVEASATGGNQGFAQLVCLLGDFTSQNPTDAALASLNSTLAWLADRYGLDTSPGATATFTSRGSNRWPSGTEVTASIVSGHRDMSQTACPGDTFYPYLVDNVQAEVDALRRAAGGLPAPPSSTIAPTIAPTSVPTPSSTAAPAPQATTTLSDPPATEPPATDTASTTAATVATDSVAPAPPPPSADEAGAEPTVSGSGRDSSSSTALAVGTGAVVLVGAGAAYVGLRGRNREAGSDGEHGLPPAACDPGRDSSA